MKFKDIQSLSHDCGFMKLPTEDAVWHRTVRSDRLKNGKKKMLQIGFRSIMLLRDGHKIHVTDALCRHMAWPLAYGGKIKDGCITCPLHQSRYDLDSGEVRDWSPFPLFPPYGRFLASLRRPSPLVVHETRELDGWVEVRLSTA